VRRNAGGRTKTVSRENAMPRLHLLPPLLALVAALAISPEPAQAQNYQRPLPLVTVTGQGSVDVPPDYAEVRLGVTTQGKTAREAGEANAKNMTALMAALGEAGIEAKDIQTSRLSLYPLYTQPQAGRNEPPRLTGYRATNEVRVKVRDLNKVGDVADRVIGAGGNEISGINFIVADPSRAADSAREAAIADARRKAEIYARATGAQVTRVFSVTEEGATPPLPLPMRAAAASMPATPISPGEQTLRVTVTVSFELMR
jgi:uncharacterized protein YggE